jgi:hypothetical protein
MKNTKRQSLDDPGAAFGFSVLGGFRRRNPASHVFRFNSATLGLLIFDLRSHQRVQEKVLRLWVRESGCKFSAGIWATGNLGVN